MGNAVSKTYDEVDDGGIPYRFYRIKCYKTNKTYIGKTIKSLDERLRKHITSANFYNSLLNDTEKCGEKNCGSFGIVYETIRGVDYDIELLKELVLDSELHARITEQIYLDEERLINIGNVANMREAYVSKENQKINQSKYKKDKYKHDAEYRENTKIKQKKNYDDKYKNDKECREHRKNYSINYGNTHREKINERSKKQFICELCGGRYTRCHKNQHFNSNKHKSKIN